MVNKIALASILIETLVSDGISIQLPRTKSTMAIYAESVLKGLKNCWEVWRNGHEAEILDC